VPWVFRNRKTIKTIKFHRKTKYIVDKSPFLCYCAIGRKILPNITESGYENAEAKTNADTNANAPFPGLRRSGSDRFTVRRPGFGGVV
jgi:hypothetical protein